MSRSEISIPISTKLFVELVDFLRRSGSDRDPVDAIGHAIEMWMAISKDTPTAIHSEEKSKASPHDLSDLLGGEDQTGFWWKAVHIPAGSMGRMTYRGRTYSAEVVDGGFRFEGDVRSPSEFTWAVTKTNRNAWRDIEIKFPGSEKWVLADQLRRQAEIDNLI